MSTNFDKIVRSWMNNEKMSGYIKKSALAEELLNLAIAGKDKIKISSVINMIEGLPAADVAPVVHAHWITAEDDDFWTCSNCRKFIHKNCAQGYCPKCGAKMSGEKNG